MKKLMVLGGTKNQIPLIESAKKEGYYVIVCDWTNDNPGIFMADKHYQISTLDREKVLEVAISENIDGIISNSEAAMQNVAYISEQLGLVGNTEGAIENLTSKERFRAVQKKAEVYAPNCFEAENVNELNDGLSNMKYPLILKPSESSGSRGTTKITNETSFEDLMRAFDECKEFSRNGKVTIEEFVEMPTLTVIEGDLFVLNDGILWDGLFFTKRSKHIPMLPMTYTLPFKTDETKLEKIQDTLHRIFSTAGIRHGEYNVEMYFNSNNELFVIEINARQGGQGIPNMIKKYCGIDMTKLLVTTAMGDDYYWEELKNYTRECNYLIRHAIFPKENGVFKDLYIDEFISKNIDTITVRCERGEKVRKTKNATDCLGVVDLMFFDYDTQQNVANSIEKYIYPIIE